MPNGAEHDSQNPFAQVLQPTLGSTVEVDPQNPFAEVPGPESIPSALAFLKSLPRSFAELITVPLELVHTGLENITGGPLTTEELIENKARFLGMGLMTSEQWDRAFEKAKLNQEKLGRAAVAESRFAKIAPHLRRLPGEPWASFVERVHAAQRAVGIEPLESVEAQLLGLLPPVFVGHIVEAALTAQTSEELGSVLASGAAGTFAFASPLAKGVVTRRLPPLVPAADAIVQRAAAERISWTRQLNYRMSGGRSTEPGAVRDVPLPVGGELAGIKRRLLAEEAGDVATAIARVQRSLGPYTTTVIPGLQAAHAAVLRDKGFAGTSHIRSDGLHDVALFGDKSPLAVDNRLLGQFQRTGFFEGQEVSWNGKNYVIAEIGAPKKIAGGFEVLLRDAEGSEAVVGTTNLRRLPATEVSLPIAATVRAEPFTPFDAAELISTTAEILDPVTAGARRAITPVVFDKVISRVLGQETGEITTIPRGETRVAPGVTAHITVERFPEITSLFDDPLPDNTTYIYADPSGKPVAFMEVNVFFNGGFPGAGKQLIQQVGLPPQPVVQGKVTAGITGFMVDPRAPKILQGRAALALMERANELGVTRVFGGVDEAGLRLTARFINKYIGKKKVVETRFGVGEMRVNEASLWNDFKQYYDNARTSDKVAARLGGEGRAGNADVPEVGNNFDVGVVDPWTTGSFTFDDIVRAFAKESGFLPEEVPGLQRFLEQRAAKELRELYLTPDEKALFNETSAYLREAFGEEPRPLEVLGELAERGQLPLSSLASTNNVTAEWKPGGVIEVRARDQGNTLLGLFRTEEGAREFINKLGQADGPELTGASDIPHGALARGATPPPPGTPSNLMSGVPPNLPPDPLRVSWLPPGDRVPAMADYFASTLTLITEWDRLFNAYDNRFGTTLSNHTRAISEKLRIVESERHPWLLRLQGADKLLKKRSRDRAAVLARYAETMTADEVAAQGFFRPLNSTELNIGNLLAEMRVDLARVEEFVRKTLELEDRLAGDPLATATAELMRELRMDRDHMAAATLLRRVRDMDVADAYVGHIIRYADARMMEAAGIDLSEAGFARSNKLTPAELGAMKQLDVIGNELATVFDIPEYRRIKRWLPHYVAYSERGVSPTQAFLGQKGLGNIKEVRFVSELARTGELTTYVNDPVLAMMRYINAGFRAKHLNPVLETAINSFKSQLEQLPEGAPRRAIEQNLARYVEDVRGVPEASRSMVSNTVAELLKRIGVEATGDLGRNIVNAILGTYSLKFIAFRMFQGIRDYWSGWGVGYWRLGRERTTTAHKLGFSATHDEIAALQRSGATPPGMSPIEVESPAALVTGGTALRRGAVGLATKALSKYVDFIQATSDIGLRASLQPRVYSHWHAGWYLESRARALSTFNDLAFGKATDAAAFRKLDLDAYSPAFTRQLQELVRASKYEEAAHLYGQETGRMVMVTYGRTMHPKGWSTNVGRFLGQYGRYPTWLTNNLVEGLSRGSRAYRVRSLVRLATFHAITLAVLEKTLGIDAYNWLLLPAVRWFGGPVVGLARATLDLLSPNDAVRAKGGAELERQLSPIPLAARDIFTGVGLMDENAPAPTNPLEVLLRASGARIAEQPSALDRLLGTQ